MKPTYYLMQHNRGNHSAQQVYYHGKIHLSGNKTECKKELVRMRKFCKEKFHQTSTNDKMTEFVDYQMSDIFFIKVDNEEVTFSY